VTSEVCDWIFSAEVAQSCVKSISFWNNLLINSTASLLYRLIRWYVDDGRQIPWKLTANIKNHQFSWLARLGSDRKKFRKWRSLAQNVWEILIRTVINAENWHQEPKIRVKLFLLVFCANALLESEALALLTSFVFFKKERKGCKKLVLEIYFTHSSSVFLCRMQQSSEEHCKPNEWFRIHWWKPSCGKTRGEVRNNPMTTRVICRNGLCSNF